MPCGVIYLPRPPWSPTYARLFPRAERRTKQTLALQCGRRAFGVCVADKDGEGNKRGKLPVAPRRKTPMPDHLVHPIDPWFIGSSHTLLLGSFPSPLSREKGFPYGNPTNRFWRVIAGVYGQPVPQTLEGRRSLILDNGLALWDVIRSCSIEGASDASIAEVVPNDLGPLLEAGSITRIFTTGGKAFELYRAYLEPAVGIKAVRLPSTSAANARMRLEDLIGAYRVLLD